MCVESRFCISYTIFITIHDFIEITKLECENFNNTYFFLQARCALIDKLKYHVHNYVDN